ncbi:MAG: NRDE family protein [Saprospiraceae bacterium]|nr:NRDE family protein [Saprospiraceae bacterium]
MCTVTYLPYRDGFILTHNRDEAPARSPQQLSLEQRGRNTLLFPKDTKAGGTWIACSRSGQTACLLNGAFLKHAHQPPYRKSRGLVLLEFFDWTDPDAFFERYELDGIEPFTFLFFQPGQVTEFRWDGAARHRKDLPPGQSHFWCSATLYPPPMQERREQLFRQWLDKRQAQLLAAGPRLPAAIQQLHHTGSIGDPENDYVMNRAGRVRTVSVTQLILTASHLNMRYHDLLEGFRETRNMRRTSDNTEKT